jgi:hypothetical protein
MRSRGGGGRWKGKLTGWPGLSAKERREGKRAGAGRWGERGGWAASGVGLKGKKG